MKFTRLVSTPAMRNDQIIRYSGVRQTDPESLSVHIVDVMMMGYVIVRTMNNSCRESIDIGLFLEKAMLHDLDEVLTGDMPRATKYYNNEIHTQMKIIANDAMLQVSEDFFADPKVFKVWSESKEGKEGIIVKIVDMLSVASKVMKEVELLNNNYFLKVAYEVREHLLELVTFLDRYSPYTDLATDYLKNTLLEAHAEVERIWQDKKDVAKRYGILENILQKNGIES